MNNANIIALNSRNLEAAAIMVAKSHSQINPIVLGSKIAMIENLRARLAKGEIVEFDYVRKGSSTNGAKVIRHAVGCLFGPMVAPRITGRGVPNIYYGNQTYWDLEKSAFRCFSLETLCKVYN